VDRDAADVVVRAFKKRGIKVVTGVEVDAVDRGRSEVVVRYRVGGEAKDLPVDKVIVSVGRRPLSDGIELETTDVKVDERGFIQVDGQMRTTVPGVYAVGDVVPGPQLAHVAFAEAIVTIKTILGESVSPIEYDKVPWGIYSHPEVAFSGLTEQVARDRGYDVVTTVRRFAGNGRALIIGEPDGLVKLVAERDGPLLGVHIVGPWATELLGEGYLAVNWEATAKDLEMLVHPHPTLSEVFGESAIALTGRFLHG
jgi:dihydrolipoamide dehydrogenase